MLLVKNILMSNVGSCIGIVFSKCKKNHILCDLFGKKNDIFFAIKNDIFLFNKLFFYEKYLLYFYIKKIRSMLKKDQKK